MLPWMSFNSNAVMTSESVQVLLFELDRVDAVLMIEHERCEVAPQQEGRLDVGNRRIRVRRVVQPRVNAAPGEVADEGLLAGEGVAAVIDGVAAAVAPDLVRLLWHPLRDVLEQRHG